CRARARPPRAPREPVGPVLTLIAEDGVVVPVLLPLQCLAHRFRIVGAAHEPVTIAGDIREAVDRLAVLRLAEALALLAVADILENLSAVDEENLLGAHLNVEEIADRVVQERREPRRPFEVALGETGVGPGGGHGGRVYRCGSSR